MPGLEQLKQFSEDVANLGNELTIRGGKGEPVVRVPLPVDIPEDDDSDDFVLGMPLQDDSSDDSLSQLDMGEDDGLDLGSPKAGDYSAFPELDSLLNPEPVEAMDFSDFPELNDFLNTTAPAPAEDSAPADSTGGFDLPDFDSLGGDTPSAAAGSDSADGLDAARDFDLPDFDSLGGDTLSAAAGPDSAGGFDLPDFDSLGGDTLPADAGSDSAGGFDLPDFDSLGGEPSIQVEDAADDERDFEIPDFDGLGSDSFAQSEAADAGPDFSDGPDSAAGFEGAAGGGDFDLPDFDNLGGEPSIQVEDAADDERDFEIPDFDGLGSDSFAQSETADAGPDSANGPEAADSFESAGGGFDLPDFDSMGEGPSIQVEDAADDEREFETPDFDSLGDTSQGDADSLDSTASPADTEGQAAFDTEEQAAFDTEGQADSDFGGDESEQIDTDVAAESTDDSQPDGIADTGAQQEHEVFDAPDDPFGPEQPQTNESFSDFDIPGFSDQAAGAAMAKPKRQDTAGADGKKEKNTLSDKEYETFLKNLRGYPLNLRIELEKFVVGDEFKDDVVFEVVQKVIKKASARQLATHLEKLLDISIPVPREFERRTAAQYEEYKKSAEYQIKNRILPVAIISVMAACILYVVFLFGKNFVYEPLKANSLYKEGYALLEAGAYPQSEMKFDEALTYQQQKRWFFTYADGYRKHKQYERARMMYKAGLQRFKQDKEMGLEYAKMELYDLRNFENAEAVVRREVLDYHINDPDGLLLLGDIFLEWGDDRDPAKYEDAKQVYDELMEIYGQQDVYLARLMRYYIRMDDLRNVLQMKEYFYPKPKSLGGLELIELSGYLLDKSSGNIAPADEYLFSSIEDVRELLERAVEAAPNEPESLYNMGLYFIDSNNSTNAKTWLSAALTSFENAAYKPRKRLLRQLNTYRLLGDLDVENKEYISAEENYRMGISLFEKEAAAGLAGDRNVGRLYASLADINYLIIGDYDEALRNYTIASNTHYGTPSVHYKMGYINYSQKKFGEALDLFIKTASDTPSDTHVLYALGNVLSTRGDNFAAQGYYQRLMNILDQQRVKYEILFPQVNDEHKEIVEMYKMGANNLGVTLYRLSRQTGDSSMNAEALTNFTASMRANDALERNQETLVRMPGSNLAEQNIKYMSQPLPEFEPSIYTEIPALPEGEFLPK